MHQRKLLNLQNHGLNSMNMNLFNEIQTFLKDQPMLEIVENEKEFILTGIYNYSLECNGYIAEGERKVRFCISKDFPNSIPMFYVFDYPNDIEHIYSDGNVCLATIGEMIHFLNRNTSLLAFIDKFINSFVFTLDWFEKYNTYPFGDRQHGYKGLLDYYINDLKLTKEQYKEMVLMIYQNKYRGHLPCFCGSKEKLRDCHGEYILPIIQNENYKVLYLKEAYSILTEDGKNVSK